MVQIQWEEKQFEAHGRECYLITVDGVTLNFQTSFSLTANGTHTNLVGLNFAMKKDLDKNR